LAHEIVYSVIYVIDFALRHIAFGPIDLQCQSSLLQRGNSIMGMLEARAKSSGFRFSRPAGVANKKSIRDRVSCKDTQLDRISPMADVPIDHRLIIFIPSRIEFGFCLLGQLPRSGPGAASGSVTHTTRWRRKVRVHKILVNSDSSSSCFASSLLRSSNCLSRPRPERVYRSLIIVPHTVVKIRPKTTNPILVVKNLPSLLKN
jgi:hypothetical protein